MTGDLIDAISRCRSYGSCRDRGDPVKLCSTLIFDDRGNDAFFACFCNEVEQGYFTFYADGDLRERPREPGNDVRMILVIQHGFHGGVSALRDFLAATHTEICSENENLFVHRKIIRDDVVLPVGFEPTTYPL